MFNHKDLEPLQKIREQLTTLINTTDNHITKIGHIFKEGQKILSFKLNLLENSLGKLTRLNHYEQYWYSKITTLQANLEILSTLSFIDFVSDEDYFEHFALAAIQLEEFWLLKMSVENGVRLDGNKTFIYYFQTACHYDKLEDAEIFLQLASISMPDRCALINSPSTTLSSKLDHLKQIFNYKNKDFPLYEKLVSNLAKKNQDNLFQFILKHKDVEEDAALDILETIFSVDARDLLTIDLLEKDSRGRNAWCIVEEKPKYWEKVTKFLHERIVQYPIAKDRLSADVFSNMQTDNPISGMYKQKKYTALARAIENREKLRIEARETYNIQPELFNLIWSKNEYYMVSIDGLSIFNLILKNEIPNFNNDPYFKQATKVMPLGRTYIWQGYNLENIKKYVATYQLEDKFDDRVILDSAAKKDDPDFSLLQYAISMSKYKTKPQQIKDIFSEYHENVLLNAVRSEQPKKVIWLIKEIGCDPSFVYNRVGNILKHILLLIIKKIIKLDMGLELIKACLENVSPEVRKKIVNHQDPGTPSALEWANECERPEKLKQYLIKCGADQKPSNTTILHTYGANKQEKKIAIVPIPEVELELELILNKSGYARLNAP